MSKVRIACEVCDKVPDAQYLSPRDWCLSCEHEFHEWRARLPVACPVGDCPTPMSCRIMKRCAAREAFTQIEADIQADPDLMHVHNAEGID